MTTPLRITAKPKDYRSVELDKNVLFTVNHFIEVFVSERDNGSGLYSDSS